GCRMLRGGGNLVRFVQCQLPRKAGRPAPPLRRQRLCRKRAGLRHEARVWQEGVSRGWRRLLARGDDAPLWLVARRGTDLARRHEARGGPRRSRGPAEGAGASGRGWTVPLPRTVRETVSCARAKTGACPETGLACGRTVAAGVRLRLRSVSPEARSGFDRALMTKPSRRERGPHGHPGRPLLSGTSAPASIPPEGS